MNGLMQQLDMLLRPDLVAAVVLGAVIVLFWRRVLPLLVLLAIGIAALRMDLQQHLGNASPVVIAIGAVVLGLAVLQAAVVLLFGNQAANGAIGHLVANLVVGIIKAPFLLLFAIGKRAFRIGPRARGPSSG